MKTIINVCPFFIELNRYCERDDTWTDIIHTTFDSFETIEDLEDLEELTNAICPFCKQIVDEEGIMIDAYNTKPMVWCLECDARSFLHSKPMNKYTIDQALTEFPQYKEQIEEITKDKRAKFVFATFEYYKIKRISNWQMYEIQSDTRVSDDIVRELISIYDVDSVAKKTEFMAIHNMKERGHESSEDYFPDKNEDFWNISLPVDSWDTVRPQIPYPSNIDLNHAGIYIHTICEDENGGEFNATYWGD